MRECFGVLSAGQRALLGMRFGLGGQRPHSRAQTARRFGVPVSRVARAERGAIGRLRGASGDSCGGGAIPAGAEAGSAVASLLGGKDTEGKDGGKAPAGTAVLDQRARDAAAQLAGDDDDSLLDNYLWVAFVLVLLVGAAFIGREARKALRR